VSSAIKDAAVAACIKAQLADDMVQEGIGLIQAASLYQIGAVTAGEVNEVFQASIEKLQSLAKQVKP
jgi:hypothetical protein